MFDYDTIDLEGMLKRTYNKMSQKQRAAVGLGKTNGRILLNMWMGTGKTVTALTIGLCFKPQVWLVIGSKNTFAGWLNQIEEWYPELYKPENFQFVRGTASQRQKAYQTPALFYFTTFSSFIRDVKWLLTKKVNFNVISIDELQKMGFRNRKSQIFKGTKALLKHIEHYFKPVRCITFMTGTWASKGTQQQWPVLNILAPREFPSYWQHVNTYCIVIKGQFGSEIIGPKNTDGLARVTSPYVYTITEEEAKDELPPIQRIKLNTELTPEIEEAYWTLTEEMFYETEDSVESVTTVLASYIKLRQLICCPYLLNPNWGVGPAIEAVADKIKENDEVYNWKHNIVFTPFIPSIPIFKQYFIDELNIRESKVITLQGGIEIEELREKEERFRKDPETMIIASIKYSQAWNAETTLNCYFPHFEWDQDENKQAEARSRRKDGTQLHIGSYYVNIRGTITEDMFDVLNRKEGTVQQFNKSIMDLRAKLRKQLEQRS